MSARPPLMRSNVRQSGGAVDEPGATPDEMTPDSREVSKPHRVVQTRLQDGTRVVVVDGAVYGEGDSKTTKAEVARERFGALGEIWAFGWFGLYVVLPLAALIIYLIVAGMVEVYHALFG